MPSSCCPSTSSSGVILHNFTDLALAETDSTQRQALLSPVVKLEAIEAEGTGTPEEHLIQHTWQVGKWRPRENIGFAQGHTAGLTVPFWTLALFPLHCLHSYLKNTASILLLSLLKYLHCTRVLRLEKWKVQEESEQNLQKVKCTFTIPSSLSPSSAPMSPSILKSW